MARFQYLNYNSIHFYLLLLVTTGTSTRLVSNPSLQDGACGMIDCGQGKCKASTTSLLGYDCECNPGWRKIQIGHFIFSPCVIPNCTVDFQCDTGSPPPPAAPLLLPPPNLSDRYIGSDCNASVGLGPPATPPPPPPPPSLDTHASDSRRNGPAEILVNCSRILHAAMTITLLALLIIYVCNNMSLNAGK